jgi:excinuclease ABC subunit C
MVERPASQSIPDAPGSYQFLDAEGRVLYVGKASSLRQRLSSYFADPATLPPKTAQLVASSSRVEWIQVANEVEALLLEYTLIKQHRPRFNVRLRDDKSYPWLAVTVSEQWPRPMVMRGRRRPGVRYFGPYVHARAIRETLDCVLKTFPLRTCSDAKLGRHQALGRPCLLYHIERCSGPCVGRVSEARYRELTEGLLRFLDGDSDDVVARLEAEMAAAASVLEFERAARLRDQLASIRRVLERQQMVAAKEEDLDVFALVEDELEAVVGVFHVRRGRVVGRGAKIVDKVEDTDAASLLASVLVDHYADVGIEVPKEVLVPLEPAGSETMASWLAERRGGRSVSLRVPRRGDKHRLLETVEADARELFARHKLERAQDHNARAKALRSLQDALGLAEAPLRIECYDCSHLQGTYYVGSMVVMEDGLPKRSDYRRFRIKTVPGNDDYAAMAEMLRRRLARLRSEEGPGAGEEPSDNSAEVEAAGSSEDGTVPGGKGRKLPRRFSYRPNLLLIDGGKGQLGVVLEVLEELGLGDELQVAALAKQFEEVYLPGQAEPVRIPRGSEALYLLQQVRDEAHRFAITYHRTLRGKQVRASVLDGVPGLGPARRKRLLSEFGGLAGLKRASLEDLTSLPWLPEPVARAVFDHLHSVSKAS